ncbi:hypothetical protein N566_26240 [Streptomycetaceae bacterium MP113-05]|nr:hypothetical protein N566_26240 [Streptomycetaceae bacterium MP113-05]
MLGALREDFPGVTVSRIRFLEAEGLVRPERSASGHRRFREADVRRLRLVLALQRDHCLPLRAVRDFLDSHGAEPDARAHAPAASAPTDHAVPPSAGRLRTSRDRFRAATGAGADQCAQWEDYGLFRPDTENCYEVRQVAAARNVAELARHGLEPRHLRAVKAAAERSADLVAQVVAPLRANRDPRVRARAEVTARELAHLVTGLHDAFLRAALSPPPDRDSGPAGGTLPRGGTHAERVPDYPNRPGTS